MTRTRSRLLVVSGGQNNLVPEPKSSGTSTDPGNRHGGPPCFNWMVERGRQEARSLDRSSDRFSRLLRATYFARRGNEQRNRLCRNKQHQKLLDRFHATMKKVEGNIVRAQMCECTQMETTKNQAFSTPPSLLGLFKPDSASHRIVFPRRSAAPT
jgi:hypothetical protein